MRHNNQLGLDCSTNALSEDDLWIYDGCYYDLTEYEESHPGGIAIKMARGTDCTDLVEQIHPFKRDKIKAILNRYKVEGLGSNNFKKSIINGAYLDFLIRAEAVLKENNLTYSDVTKSSIAGWGYVIFGFISFYGFLGLFLLGINPWVIAPILGVAMAYHSQFLLHDGSHLSIASSRSLNFLLTLYASGLIQYGDFIKDHWNHHLNTNDIEKDADISHLTDFFRLVPQQNIQSWHRYQYLLFYLLGPILAILVSLNWFRVSLFNRLDMPWLPFFYEIWHKLFLFLFVFLLNVWPFFLFGFSIEAFWSALAPRAVQWYLFMNVFQWSHFHDQNSESLQFNKGDTNLNFFEHVLSTTQNVCERNPIMKYLLVGNQIQHHLIPLVSTSRTHLFVDITKETAQKYSIKYHETPNLLDQISSNYSYFKKMSG